MMVRGLAFRWILVAVAFICQAGSIVSYAKIVWHKSDTIKVFMPEGLRPVAHTAAEMLADDLRKVLDASVVVAECLNAASIVAEIDTVKVPLSQGFMLSAGDDGILKVLAHGSHGVAYGLMELSRQSGVSPWVWWADSEPAKLDSLAFDSFPDVIESPSVEYRGIFVNDEDWGLMPWSCRNYDVQPDGVVGPKTTAKIFELLLRLKANTYWPPMHECTVPFFLTPGNREVAEKYGIYIGGSHCEPMASSTAGEWPRRGKGEYDYVANDAGVRDFWKTRLDEVAGQEIIYTLGMRGVHDGAMQGADGIVRQKEVLSRVLSDQRDMLGDYGLLSAPQVFIPYKEVLDIYNAGLDVPEDVTLMWCDDNYGYIRHFPDSLERSRKGGNGIYYHVSYWGRPHDYLWLGTFSPGLLFQQMDVAYRRGIDRMWILNVGDIKPAEYQIELFLDMAWNIDKVRDLGVEGHNRRFLFREFGEKAASRLVPVMEEHYRLAFIRKPEFMGNTRTEEWGTDYYNHVRDLPWSESAILERLDSYSALSDSVESVARIIEPNKADTYFQLVKYPVHGAVQMNRKMLYAQLSRHGRAEWTLSDAAYDSIQVLTSIYNEGIHNHGKWRGIMDSHPRQLPVFDRVKSDTAEVSIVAHFHPLVKLNGRDGIGYSSAPEWLGYENAAVVIDSNEALTFEFRGNFPAKVRLEVAFVPTHPVTGGLRVGISVDGRDFGEFDYATVGRSEEWKENVLNNRALVSVPVDLNDGTSHRISILALSDGVIVDEVCIY
ncbi:MAG: glycosyl hydrolase 115 family protein [Muribaculum sp.]|nr:glycosyl hydrolase 115 family protein [Muribaculum sp.]